MTIAEVSEYPDLELLGGQLQVWFGQNVDGEIGARFLAHPGTSGQLRTSPLNDLQVQLEAAPAESGATVKVASKYEGRSDFTLLPGTSFEVPGNAKVGIHVPENGPAVIGFAQFLGARVTKELLDDVNPKRSTPVGISWLTLINRAEKPDFPAEYGVSRGGDEFVRARLDEITGSSLLHGTKLSSLLLELYNKFSEVPCRDLDY